MLLLEIHRIGWLAQILATFNEFARITHMLQEKVQVLFHFINEI